MEKHILDYRTSDVFVRNALISLGFPTNIRVETSINAKDYVSYMAEYEKVITYELEKHIMPISKENYVMLLKSGMELNNCSVNSIDVAITDGKIWYAVAFEKNQELKRRKGRK